MIIEISTGEALDKLSILRIKLQNIKDPEKIINIRKEHDHISSKCQDILLNQNISILYKDLVKVNNLLWNIEDSLRDKENKEQFDEHFIQLARKVYIANDHRAEIKKLINTLTKSNFVEEKTYAKY